jgi:aldose 1-epimerase
MTSTPDAGIELRAGSLRLALRPDLGGSIAGLWRDDLPVLRSTEPALLASSRAAGCYPLAPYSNRLGWRRFRWHGRDHTTAPNFDDNPHSVHGMAWQRAWQVAAHDPARAELALAHTPDADWPFAFTLRQRFVLTPLSLEVTLVATNTHDADAPMGLGWHPYFAKRSRSRLHAEVDARWEADAATQLPTRRTAQAGIDGDVAHLAYNHCFDGWQGAARIRDEKLSLKLASSLSHLVVYTPADKPYYCVEPVSHVSNAIHMADPAAHGLRTLTPGATMEAWMKLEVNAA